MINQEINPSVEQNNDLPKGSGILDNVSFSQTRETLRSFNPQSAVHEYIQRLPDREKQILIARYGLETGEAQTLENIGKRFDLTRERVRQIEKEGIKKLNKFPPPKQFREGVDLIFQIIEEKGDIAREIEILETVLGDDSTELKKANVIFVLHLTPEFNELKENSKFRGGWYLDSFDKDFFEHVVTETEKMLREEKKPLVLKTLAGKLRNVSEKIRAENPNNEILESYISFSKALDKNSYGFWGISSWPQIHPRDAGDKAYLVLEHNKEPMHYIKITEMINKRRFDSKVAQKESVHNELIKDSRFVLIGRGIYALTKWGYKKGQVADVIAEVIEKAGEPLTKEEIISRVLGQRMVKRNTIIVGLSNKKRFRKIASNKYENVAPGTN